MRAIVKDFIEDNIEFIRSNDWSQFYKNADTLLDSSSTGEVTESLLSAGIDPIHLGNLDYIPAYYLAETKLKEFKIRATINRLAEGCFSYTSLTTIELPESVDYIDDFVFYGCNKLSKVVCHSGLVGIGSSVFEDSSPIIYCPADSIIEMYALDQRLKVKHI